MNTPSIRRAARLLALAVLLAACATSADGDTDVLSEHVTQGVPADAVDEGLACDQVTPAVPC